MKTVGVIDLGDSAHVKILRVSDEAADTMIKNSNMSVRYLPKKAFKVFGTNQIVVTKDLKDLIAVEEHRQKIAAEGRRKKKPTL